MSLESALDEERREVIALLEGRSLSPRAKTALGPTRTMSPAGTRSPVRSMLDIGPPTSPPVRSMLDIGPAPPAAHSASIAATSGITTAQGRISTPSPPPLGSRRVGTSPPPSVGVGGRNIRLEEDYQFDFLPSIESQALPKRVTQAGKKKKKDTSGDGLDRDRQYPGLGIRQQKSLSPSSRMTLGRAGSPSGRMLNTNSLNLMTSPNIFISDSGKVIDMQHAYRRLSDGALLRSGGSLAALASPRKGSDPDKGESIAPDGGTRLTKDYSDSGDEHAIESSDEEDTTDSDSGWGSINRGRPRSRFKDLKVDEADGGGSKKPKSLLAAAEDERKKVASTYKVRSLLEPAITVITPDGEKPIKKLGVHPNTNFDQGSGVSTPADSDVEMEISEIRRAQRLTVTLSPIHSSPTAKRCFRTIVRGEYSKLAQEAYEGLRRQRMYLVATDISEEAAYALEWTIGTVLRDGDTLLAVYAVDEELGTGENGPSSAKQASENLAATLAAEPTKQERGLSPGRSPLRHEITDSTPLPDFDKMDKAERERYTAVMQVSERCVKLLRKTQLQVRVVVEVFHCKSPKHMLTEVIDFLEPTLVILGSRGRSALKGVLLGSFSNYLVTKSSVPVMVARKRLRKHSKYKRTNLRLSNVLTNPTNTKLAFAKVD